MCREKEKAEKTREDIEIQKENKTANESGKMLVSTIKPRAEKMFKPTSVKNAMEPVFEDAEFSQQINELRLKRKTLESDGEKLTEEVKRITESVRQRTEVN